ncbi:UDP-3-O-acyl-N-acetylglucosamine deacetylase [Estrella lausannensis]|uniref:UDP-3-O-acyl-N-acetylglucosamine deacetylase n=1 Tax=Estrella lausannensis TaxID=483423 RepID=A0A0H5E3P6_9BACT|nr:UDP-3-O-acyl-N-acetylglucosamine deacetylase [Estrella lausannensis]CRX37840.1 UDP-3-O-[3-hydroxymyristoyl] N-acetylglucosamine deacetylase [Estrella lausannensis]
MIEAITIQKSAQPQRTLKKEVHFSGIGIHTGRLVSIRFVPAAAGKGIVFKRVDLPGQPEIPALVEYAAETARSTSIGLDSIRIHTVEHVLAAIHANRIHNLTIELTNIEPPVGNGSSDVFVEMIEQAGIEELDSPEFCLSVQQPIYHSEKDIHVVALPGSGFKVSYTLDYPETPAIKSQYRSFDITAESFKKEIASCRTFALYEEVATLMDRGLIKGGSLDNAVMIKGDAIFSKGGLFFPDEMVRHKILDLIGDLTLVGYPINAHIIAIRSGHAANVALAKKLIGSLREVQSGISR